MLIKLIVVIYTYIKSLCGILKTSTMLCVNYVSTKLGEKVISSIGDKDILPYFFYFTNGVVLFFTCWSLIHPNFIFICSVT